MDSVLVLIAAPGSGAIGEDIVRAAEDLTGSAPRWLSPDEAVEFDSAPSRLSSKNAELSGIHPTSPWPALSRPPSLSTSSSVEFPVIQQLTAEHAEPLDGRLKAGHGEWGRGATHPAFAGMTELRNVTKNLPIDIAVVPSDNRRKKLLIADMDSTMIGQECIDELGAIAGLGERIAAITARAMRGELDFEEALVERVSLMRGLDEEVIGRVIRERITMMPGGRTLVATMKANGAHAALVSGGFVQFTSHVARDLGFDEHRANDLIIGNGVLDGTVRRPILGKDAKVAALHEISARLGLSPAEAIAVGDGANDIPMLQAAGLGVALHAKPTTREAAPVAIDFGDLTALLYLQGYARTEFVG